MEPIASGSVTVEAVMFAVTGHITRSNDASHADLVAGSLLGLDAALLAARVQAP